MLRKSQKISESKPEKVKRGRKKKIIGKVSLPVKIVNLKKLTTIIDQENQEMPAKKIFSEAVFLPQETAKQVEELVTKHNYHAEEERKRIIMIAGVGFFMLLFVVLWIVNLKNNLRTVNLAQNNQISEQYNIDKLSRDFDQAWQNINDMVEKNSANGQNTLPKNAGNGSSTDQIEINLLKEKLEEAIRSASGTDITASSTNRIKTITE
jgi:hypothetical protein